MQPLLDSLAKLKKCFGDDEGATIIIDREIRDTNVWIGEHTREEPNRSPRKLGRVEGSDKRHSARSVFDDIDVDDDSEGE